MVLENPDNISKTVLAKGLDSGTAFDILSIDIADVDVGENIGAKLQTDQAEADLRVARAKAEERRAAAVAGEQEQRANLVAAEAEIPQAMAEAFRVGQPRRHGLLPTPQRRGRHQMRDARSAVVAGHRRGLMPRPHVDAARAGRSASGSRP